jgi:all-trans-retinol dehydrogenase (NAD+)
MALEFAKLGANVTIWDIDKKSLDSAVAQLQKISGMGQSFVVDVTDKDSVYRAAEEVKKNVGKVDILINNAGVVAGKTFWELTDAQIERVMKVNTVSILF